MVLGAMIVLNALFVAGCFGRGYLLEAEIERQRAIADAFARKHGLSPPKWTEIDRTEFSQTEQRYEKRAELMRRYHELLKPGDELRDQQSEYYMYGYLAVMGFPFLVVVGLVVLQRERDKLALPQRDFSEISKLVFTTQMNWKGKSEQVVFSMNERKIYFDGFALLKGFVVSPKESAFEIPFESVVDCFFQPLKGGKSCIILATDRGKITIGDTISDYPILFENLKLLAAHTPEAKWYQKPWIQINIVLLGIVAGLAAVFFGYLYFFD